MFFRNIWKQKGPMKSRIAVSKAAFNKMKTLHQQIRLTFMEENGKVLHVEHSFIWCWNLYTSESIAEIPGKFYDVVF